MTALSCGRWLCGTLWTHQQPALSLQGNGTATLQAAQAYMKWTQDLDQLCHNYGGISKHTSEKQKHDALVFMQCIITLELIATGGCPHQKFSWLQKAARQSCGRQKSSKCCSTGKPGPWPGGLGKALGGGVTGGLIFFIYSYPCQWLLPLCKRRRLATWTSDLTD